MIIAVTVILVGLLSLLAGWVLPMLSDHVPRTVEILLLGGGFASVIGGALLGLALHG